MTEQDWLSCTNLHRMLNRLGHRISERKLRLLAVACCRCNWEWVPDNLLRLAIETAEQFADGFVSQRKRGVVFAAASKRAAILGSSVGQAMSHCAAKNINSISGICYGSVLGVDDVHSFKTDGSLKLPAKEEQIHVRANLLRDIFGNPYCPVTFDPAWRTPNVTAIAQTIYEERRFEDMLILADALEEAGCTSADLLNHCHGPGPHLLGCWALDLILEKE